MMMVTITSIDDTLVTYRVDPVTGGMSLKVTAPAQIGGSLHTEGSMEVKFNEWQDAAWMASWLAERTAQEAAKFEALLTSGCDDVIAAVRERGGQDDD